MKAPHAAGLLVAAVLPGLAAGGALPPDSIPLRCATICGPMVELTALCNVPHRRLAKRRRVDYLPKHQTTAAASPTAAQEKGSSDAGEGNGDGEDDGSGNGELEKRSFVTLVAPPTSLPAGFAVSTPDGPALSSTMSEVWTVQQEVSPRVSRVTPVIVVPSATTTTQPDQRATRTPDVPPPATSSSSPVPAPPISTTGLALGANGPQGTTMNPPVPSTVASSSTAAAPSHALPENGGGTTEMQPTPSTTMTSVGGAATTNPGNKMGMEQDGAGDGDGDGDGDEDGLSPEEECVCKNRSFDVPQVAGLCADCIMQGGDMQNSTSFSIIPTIKPTMVPLDTQCGRLIRPLLRRALMMNCG